MKKIDTETSSGDDFYLPAVVPDPDFSRIGTFFEDHLDLHGVVLIPESYNR